MRILFLLFIGLGYQAGLYSQQVRFNARVDLTEIGLDQYVQLEFVLENAQANSFIPPNFQGWTVISGPSTSSQVSIINGIRSSSLSYIYTLSPKSIGNLIIGPATVQVNSKTYASDAITIKVSKSAKPNIAGDVKSLSKEDLFISVTAKPEQAYVGQQIHIEYKLYTTVDVENYNISHTPDFKGFHATPIPKFNFPTNREVVNGRTFVTKVIQASSVYPIQNGTFTIDPLHARVSVVVDDAGDANSFFLLPNTKGVNVMSNPLTIEVRTLPQPMPDQFSGAVGRFKMSSAIDQPALKTNEAASITIYLEGDGDLNRVGKPYLQLDTAVFQVYEPKITKENTDYQTEGFVGMREFSYPVVALAPGIHKIIPSFIYFDTDSNKYLTLASEVFNVNVSGSAQEIAKNKGQLEGPVEILPLIINPRQGSSYQFVGSKWYYLALFFPCLVLIGRFIYQKQNQRQVLLGRSGYLKNQARQQAVQALIAMTDQLNTPGPTPPVDEINNTLSNYLRIKWDLDDRPRTLQEWQIILDGQSLAAPIKKNIKSLFTAFELAIYAGQPTGMKMNELLGQAREVVENL